MKKKLSYKLHCVIAISCHRSENLLLFFTKEHEEFFRRFSQQFTFKIELPKNIYVYVINFFH